jgi:predicted RNase H-like HicB family nuclease
MNPDQRPTNLDVVIHRDSDSSAYWAEVAQLPGCFAAGRSRVDLLESLEEAVGLYLDGEDAAKVFVSDRIEGVERFRLSPDRKLLPA